ncbi:MAG: FHA domain-containing protein [Planctomycetota bacterium]|jgi:pSer/pThr/pTyr-binding forkhead associated (FHA) protein
MGSLIVSSGPHEGDYYPLEQKTVVIGRDAKCPIQIVDDQVSRVHMQIHYDSTQKAYVATDLKSVNGVYINHNRITREVPLVNGDVILVGSTPLVFFDKTFPDRKHAWDFYKVSGERVRATISGSPDQQPH